MIAGITASELWAEGGRSDRPQHPVTRWGDTHVTPGNNGKGCRTFEISGLLQLNAATLLLLYRKAPSKAAARHDLKTQTYPKLLVRRAMPQPFAIDASHVDDLYQRAANGESRDRLRHENDRLREYDSFVSFHCARPLDVSSFYESGLKLGDIESLNRRAREIFLSDKYSWITPERLEGAIGDASDIHDKTLFAVIDEREISGHYLIYGSEHICGISASLSREIGFDCREILKLHGTPTVFRIAIPRELIPDDQLQNLSEHIMEIYWDERKQVRPSRIDWSWILKQDIQARHVLDHVRPEETPDPLMQYIPYRYRDNWPS